MYLLTEKCQMVRECYAMHLPSLGRAASPPRDSDNLGFRIEPEIWERMTEDSDEWDAFLRYNQAIIDHQFQLEEWKCNQQNYQRKLDLWGQCHPTEEQIIDLTKFHYRKRWKCHYSPAGESSHQPPVRTNGSTASGLYPSPNLRLSSLEPRVLSLKMHLTEIFDGVHPSRFLQMAKDGGWLGRLGSREMDCAGLDFCHAGYYGSRGNFHHSSFVCNLSCLSNQLLQVPLRF